MAAPSTIGQVRDVFPSWASSPTRWCSATSGSARASPSAIAASITVAALIALYRPDQLRGHSGARSTTASTREEIIELITHLAFYAGWPTPAPRR